MTTNDCKRLRVKLGMIISAIGNKYWHKNVSYDYTNNDRSKCVEKCSKNSCATLLVKIIEEYLDAEAVVRDVLQK